MSGSSGNLVAAELLRHDHSERGRDGARVIAAEHGEIIDYTQHSDPPVTTDGAATRAQLASLGHHDGTLITSGPTTKRTRTRTRTPRPIAITDQRNDDRSELQRLRSTVEGQGEEIARLAAEVTFLRDGLGRLLRRVFPGGIPVNESETT
jgi:hypothetical protein